MYAVNLYCLDLCVLAVIVSVFHDLLFSCIDATVVGCSLTIFEAASRSSTS
jgi:hypothetical protein